MFSRFFGNATTPDFDRDLEAFAKHCDKMGIAEQDVLAWSKTPEGYAHLEDTFSAARDGLARKNKHSRGAFQPLVPQSKLVEQAFKILGGEGMLGPFKRTAPESAAPHAHKPAVRKPKTFG